MLIENGIPVFLAGRGWNKVAEKYSRNDKLKYGGEGIYGDEYAEKISGYQVGLGLLSKWVPEKHTTRTFEIPACGSILATERNDETCAFFDQDEALFFDNNSELLTKLRRFQLHPEEAMETAANGFRRISTGEFDYGSIVAKVLRTLEKQCGD